jgi:hypothetical protein
VFSRPASMHQFGEYNSILVQIYYIIMQNPDPHKRTDKREYPCASGSL